MKKKQKPNSESGKQAGKIINPGLAAENRLLRSRLEEMEEVLTAIRTGAVDALVVTGSEGEKIYTLAGAERPYRVMVETMGEGAISLAQDGTILYSNKSFAYLVQIPLEKIIGSNVTQYFDPEDHPVISAALKRTRKNSRLEISLASHGKKIPVYLSVTKIKDNSSPALFTMVVTDLTHQKNEELMRQHAEQLQNEIEERRKTERELRLSEERFRAFVTASSDAVYHMNPDWTEMRELHGRDFIEITRTSSATWLQKYIPPEDQPHVLASIEQAIRSKTLFELEHRVLRADGAPGWTFSRAVPLMDEGGQIIEWIGAAKDITERMSAQETLQTTSLRLEQAHGLLKGIIENTTGLVAAIDTGYCYLAMNEAYRRECQAIYGVDIRVGDSMLEMLARYPEDKKNVIEVLNPAFEGKSVITTQTYGDLDKSRRFYEMHVSPIHDSQGRIIGAAHINIDITERIKTDEEIKRHSAQLEVANRELESFTYSVSHDLRAPLRAIDGFSRMLLNEIGDKLDPESARKFNVIIDNSRKMGRLIDDLLQLSRTGRAEVQFNAINLKPAIEEVWKELLAGNPGRDLELRVGELPAVHGDRMLLRQVLSNLLGNAVKFSRDSKKAIIEVSGSKSGNFNTYCIRDNGVGFDMRYYDKLFDIFRRLHNEKEFQGTGVGLAIVKKIIDKHGGRVWAEGKPGEGAAFYFTLPVAGPLSPA